MKGRKKERNIGKETKRKKEERKKEILVRRLKE